MLDHIGDGREGTARMSRLRWRRKLLIALGVLVLVAGAYAAWGVWLNGRYEALVDELHGMGVPEWGDPASVPDEENGWPLVVEAMRIYREVETELMDESDLWMVSSYGLDDDDWTEPIRKLWREAQPRIAACIRLIEDAARCAAIAPPAGDDPARAGFSRTDVVAVLATQVSFDRSWAARILPTLLDLATRWREHGAGGWIGPFHLRRKALERLSEGLASGELELSSFRDRLEACLTEWDPMQEARLQIRHDVTQLIWLFDEYRAGRDPLRKARETIARARDLTKGVEGGEILDRLPDPSTAWATTWIARPLLLRSAVQGLEAARDALSREMTVERLRRGESFSERMALLALAQVRLARLACRIVAFRDARGRLPEDLSEIEVPEDLRVDPVTGAPLRFETADGVTVSSDLPPWLDPGDDDEARREKLRRSNLLWRLPAR
jgi:hypothetical protein